MRKLLLFLLLLLTMSVAKAANTITVLALDGTEAAKYDVDAVSRIDLTDRDSVRFVMSDGNSVTFALNNVPKLSFIDVTTDINVPETAVSADRLRAWSDGESLYVSGAPMGDNIFVFTLSGVRIAHGKATNGTTCIDASSLPDGIYVVKVGKQALKIIKK